MKKINLGKAVNENINNVVYKLSYLMKRIAKLLKQTANKFRNSIKFIF